MAQQKASTDVKVIRRVLQEAPAIVEDTEQLPWSIREKESGRAVPWRVIIGLSADRERLPLVFETREDARIWSDRDPRARDLDWDVLQETGPSEPEYPGDPSALTDRFRDFAKEKGLPIDSREAFDLAVKAGILNTLVLYEHYGCTGEAYVVDRFLRSWADTGLSWTPSSCRSQRRSDLLAIPDATGEPPVLPLRGDVEYDSLPLLVESAYTT